MMISNTAAILFFSGIVLVSYSETLYVSDRKTCAESTEIFYEEVQEYECKKDYCIPEKEKVCDFHWVEIQGGGKRWQEDPKTCRYVRTSECQPDCKKVHKKVAKTIKRYTPMSTTPCFTQLGRDERGVPMVDVAFSGGSKDKMKIGYYMGMNDAFIGKLDDERSAGVAMTETEDGTVDVTMLSFRGSNSSTFRMLQNGEVQMLNDTTIDTVKFDNLPELKEKEPSYESYGYDKYRRRKRQTKATLEAPHKLVLRFVTSTSFRSKVAQNSFFDTEEMLRRDLMAHVQIRFCAPSLETQMLLELPTDRKAAYFHLQNHFMKIQVDDKDEECTNCETGQTCTGCTEVEESIEPIDADTKKPGRCRTCDDNYRLQFLNNFLMEEREGIDLNVFLTHDVDGCCSGTAIVESVCNKRTAFNINEIKDDGSFVSLADTIAHEIGHNLGMHHDFGAKNGGDEDEGKTTGGCAAKGFIMSYESGVKHKWSDCSNKNFRDHFNSVDSWCLPPADEKEFTRVCNGFDESTLEDPDDEDSRRIAVNEAVDFETFQPNSAVVKPTKRKREARAQLETSTTTTQGRPKREARAQLGTSTNSEVVCRRVTKKQKCRNVFWCQTCCDENKENCVKCSSPRGCREECVETKIECTE